MRRSTIAALAQALPAAVCLALIFRFSSQTFGVQTIVPLLERHISAYRLAGMLPDVSFRYGSASVSAKLAPYQFVEFLFRKGAHLFWYALLFASLYIALKALPLFASRPSARLWTAAGLLAGAASADEWNQARVAGRTGQPIDVLLDAGGGMICAILIYAAAQIVRAAYRASPRHSLRKNGRTGRQEKAASGKGRKFRSWRA